MARALVTNTLNLTGADVVLIAESGERTMIPASGYVARVEYERRLSVREPICDATDGGYITIGSDDIPIYEQAPREIVFSCSEDKDGNIPSDFIAKVAAKNQGLFLVSREVAEAAAQYVERKCMPTCDGDDGCPREVRHPLASRMVWAADPVFHCECDEKDCMRYHYRLLTGYRELRRVGGVG